MSAAPGADASPPTGPPLSLSQLADVLSRAVVPVSVLDRDSRILFTNRACGELLLQESERLVGRRLRDTFESHQMSDFEERIRRVTDTRVTESYEEELSFPSGVKWRATVLSPVSLAPGDTAVVLCVSIDTTARKQTEAALVERFQFEQLIAETCSGLVQAGEDEIETVIDRTLQAIGEYMAVDRVLLFEFDSDRAQLSCCNEWHAVGIEPAIQRLRRQPRSQFTWLFPRLLAGQPLLVPNVRQLPDEASAERDELLRHGVLSLVWVPLRFRNRVVGALCLDSLRRQRDWPEKLVARLQLAGDIIANARGRIFAERALAASRQELARVDRLNLLGEMVAGIAHELSQPLCALNNFVTAAKSRLQQPARTDPGDLISWLDAANTASRNAGEILRRLRLFTRGHPVRQRQIEPFIELVEEALQLLHFEVSRRRMRVELLKHGPPAMLRADRVQIQQVLINLIQNACDAVESAPSADSTIQVETLCRPEEIEVRVRDRGIGLPEDERRIFDPFVTTKPRGLGLGLAISKTIIEEHGGRMWATRNPGAGSTFHFILPRSDLGPSADDGTPAPEQ